MLKVLSSSEQRVKVLNSMRASHYGAQLLKQGRIASATPKETVDQNRWASSVCDVELSDKDMMKETADMMYATTGDTIWFSF